MNLSRNDGCGDEDVVIESATNHAARLNKVGAEFVSRRNDGKIYRDADDAHYLCDTGEPCDNVLAFPL